MKLKNDGKSKFALDQNFLFFGDGVEYFQKRTVLNNGVT